MTSRVKIEIDEQGRMELEIDGVPQTHHGCLHIRPTGPGNAASRVSCSVVLPPNDPRVLDFETGLLGQLRSMTREPPVVVYLGLPHEGVLSPKPEQPIKKADLPSLRDKIKSELGKLGGDPGFVDTTKDPIGLGYFAKTEPAPVRAEPPPGQAVLDEMARWANTRDYGMRTMPTLPREPGLYSDTGKRKESDTPAEEPRLSSALDSIAQKMGIPASMLGKPVEEPKEEKVTEVDRLKDLVVNTLMGELGKDAGYRLAMSGGLPDMASWKQHVDEAMAAWRKDPSYTSLLPLPQAYEQVARWTRMYQDRQKKALEGVEAPKKEEPLPVLTTERRPSDISPSGFETRYLLNGELLEQAFAPKFILSGPKGVLTDIFFSVPAVDIRPKLPPLKVRYLSQEITLHFKAEPPAPFEKKITARAHLVRHFRASDPETKGLGEPFFSLNGLVIEGVLSALYVFDGQDQKLKAIDVYVDQKDPRPKNDPLPVVFEGQEIELRFKCPEKAEVSKEKVAEAPARKPLLQVDVSFGIDGRNPKYRLNGVEQQGILGSKSEATEGRYTWTFFVALNDPRLTWPEQEATYGGSPAVIRYAPLEKMETPPRFEALRNPARVFDLGSTKFELRPLEHVLLLDGAQVPGVLNYLMQRKITGEVNWVLFVGTDDPRVKEAPKTVSYQGKPATLRFQAFDKSQLSAGRPVSLDRLPAPTAEQVPKLVVRHPSPESDQLMDFYVDGEKIEGVLVFTNANLDPGKRTLTIKVSVDSPTRQLSRKTVLFHGHPYELDIIK